MRHGAAKIFRSRHRIVIEEINQFTARGFHGRIALDGGLFATGDDDFKVMGRVIERATCGNGFDVALLGASCDQDGDAREVFVHEGKLESGG